MTVRRRAHDGEAGDITAAIAVTALLFLAFFAIGALRIVGTGGDVDAAARAAARAASATGNAAAAEAAASSVAGETLAHRGVACQGLTVAVGGDLAAGGIVTVEVTCVVSLADVVLVGFPGTRTLTGHGIEQVDQLRGGT